MYSIEDRDDLKNLNELVSLQNQVKAIRLQDKLGTQNFHEDLSKVFEPVTRTVKNVSEDITKTMMISSKQNNLALEDLNNKLLEIMNDRAILASYLMFLLSKITNHEKTSQFKLVKDSNSNRVNDLLVHNSITITLYDHLLSFRDTGRVFQLKGDLLKMITNRKHPVYLASLQGLKNFLILQRKCISM